MIVTKKITGSLLKLGDFKVSSSCLKDFFLVTVTPNSVIRDLLHQKINKMVTLCSMVLVKCYQENETLPFYYIIVPVYQC